MPTVRQQRGYRGRSLRNERTKPSLSPCPVGQPECWSNPHGHAALRAGHLAAVSQVAACGQVSRLPDFPSFRRLWLAPNTHPASLMVSTLRPTLVSLLSFRPAATCVACPPLSLPALRLFPNVLTGRADQRFLRRSLRSARHGRNGEQCTAEWNSVQQNLAIFCATWVQ